MDSIAAAVPLIFSDPQSNHKEKEFVHIREVVDGEFVPELQPELGPYEYEGDQYQENE